LKEKINWKKV